MKNFKLLLSFINGDIVTYLFAFIAINLAALFAAVIPTVIKVTIDSVIGDKPMDLPWGIDDFIERFFEREYLLRNLWVCGIILLVFTIFQGTSLFLKDRIAATASQNAGKSLREKVYNHLQHLPYDYHVNTHAGDLIQRCTSDIETAQNFVSSQMIELAQSILSFTYVLVIMLSIDARYTLVSVVLIPFVLISTFVFFQKMQKIFRLTDESDGRLSTTLQENLTGVRVVRAFGTQSHEIEKFDKKNSEYAGFITKILELMSNFWSLSDFMCLSQFAIVILTGVYMASSGMITLGTFVAFSTYIGMLVWPVRNLGQLLASMGQAFVSISRVEEILENDQEFDDTEDLKPKIKGHIEFENVSFNYKDEKPVLKDISLSIVKGQTVAFLGATGSGKTSLVHLLIRLYDYQKGSIRIDGIEVKDIDKKWLRKSIGLVLQESYLFSKTIEENIRMGKPSADTEEVLSAAKMSELHETIKRFDKGYDTVLGERGVTLSGGQRQRLSIARTIIRDVPILIFDDSLSAVDLETDASIRKALKQRSNDTTTIIISHRITTLSEADKIYVLEDGTIKQEGTHEELIAMDGLYQRVWAMQNSLEEEIIKLA